MITESNLLERAAALAGLAPDTPEIVLDLDVVRANIDRAAATAHEMGVVVRPHTKTHKLPRIAHMQVEAGAVGVQVAKLGEAEVMADGGIEDILVGYPIVGEHKLARLADLAERVTISVTVDSDEVAAGISRVARERGLTIPVLIELDTGLRRLGVLPGPAAADLAERIAALPGIELAGVFSHEGHVYTQARDDGERERLTQEACRAAVDTAEVIRSRGLAAPIVSVGSAGTFRFAVRCPGVTEVRPGTYVFNDRSQIAQGAATAADLAAFVITTVVSRPTPERIVVDAGSKVLTSDRMLVPDPPASFGRVWGHNDWDVVRLSEEHGVLEVPPDAEARVGDRLAIVPNHVCPTINLASAVTVVEGGQVVGHWPVAARGRVQ
jgi:D-serine deaminase-like pyridoxal phosphate-dependent protein